MQCIPDQDYSAHDRYKAIMISASGPDVSAECWSRMKVSMTLGTEVTDCCSTAASKTKSSSDVRTGTMALW